MKTTFLTSVGRSRMFHGLALGVMAFTLAAFSSRDRALIAHEWGTFTSVQGGDGAPIGWKPLESSDLPEFVYDWKKPGLNRRLTSAFGGKGMLYALQRMETPVIYFYTDIAQNVDVTVRFPQGLVTEWYPQVREIGPSALTVTNTPGERGTRESMIRWSNLEVSPAKRDSTRRLLSDNSASHYFAARETDAALVRADASATGGESAEYEKFLFYRGIASFVAPLKVTMNDAGNITLHNTGKEGLGHLFALEVRDGQARFVYRDRLARGETQSLALHAPMKPLSQVADRISRHMAAALVKERLYPREAEAMVATWKDSWFREDGLRVLYVLPQAWTDRTLPITVKPEPRELVRVMVGRAEIIHPSVEKSLAVQLERASGGDAQAKEQLQQTLEKLGRFANPALTLAGRNAALESGQREKLLASLRARSAE